MESLDKYCVETGLEIELFNNIIDRLYLYIHSVLGLDLL